MYHTSAHTHSTESGFNSIQERGVKGHTAGTDAFITLPLGCGYYNCVCVCVMESWEHVGQAILP